MLWEVEYVGDKFKATVQWVVDLLSRVLGDIFDFVLSEEGYVAE